MAKLAKDKPNPSCSVGFLQGGPASSPAFCLAHRARAGSEKERSLWKQQIPKHISCLSYFSVHLLCLVFHLVRVKLYSPLGHLGAELERMEAKHGP